MKKILTLFTALLFFGSMMTVKAVTYTPAGDPASVFGETWNPGLTANDMTLSSGLYVFAKKDNFSATSILFKVCKDHGWGTAYPGSNYSFTIPNGSKYLIITYNTSGNEVNAFAISSMTVAGDNGTLFGSTWAPTATANDMTLQDNGTYKFEKTGVALSAGTVKFKAAANHAWTNAWPSSDYSLSIPESGNYTITITFDPKTLSVSASADLEQAVVVIPTIQLHSNIQNPSWASTANFDIAGNNETASLTLTGVTKGNYEFGVKIDGTWTSNGTAFTRANNSHTVVSGSGNCTFNADRNGDYTFTWTYATSTLEIGYPAIPSQSVSFNSLASQILKGSVINLANCVTSSGIDEPTYRFYIKEKNGEYGDAINANHSFNTNGEYVVKVEALEYGEPVAYDESEVVVYQSYTFTNGSTIYVDFSAMTEGSKEVNYPKVDQVGIDYDANGAGTIKTITFTANVTWTTIADAFIKTGKNGWAAQPFTVPGIGQDLVIVAADGASYTWGTYVPAPPTIKMHGNFLGEWNNTDAFVVAGNKETASLELTIPAKGTKNFGMRIGSDSDWTSNGAAITRASASAEIVAGEGNCSLNADIPGAYTFTWTYATNTLSVTYPDLPAQSVSFDGLSAEIFKGTAVNFAATSMGITNPVYSFYVKPAGGEYGSAVSSYTFDAVGSFTVKVSAEGDNTIDPIVEEENIAVYDTYTFTAGTRIYVDFTAMTEGAKNVNYPFGHVATSDPLDYDENGAGTFKTIRFSENVTWSTMSDFIKTAKAGWAGQKFTIPAEGQNKIIVAADGASYTWGTYTPATVQVKFFAPRDESNNWDHVYAHSWDAAGDITSWPGVEITGSKAGDWYAYGVQVGANLLFHNNDGMQTNNIEDIQEAACYESTAINYEVTPKLVTVTANAGCEIAYYIAGSKALIGGSVDFDTNLPLDENNQIVFEDVVPGTYSFKINNGSWAWAIGGNDHLKEGDCASIAATVGVGDVGFQIDTKQDITITYYPATQEICLGAETIEPIPDIEAIGGKFIINAKGDTAVFSRGNLQYKQTSDKWRCAPKQYDWKGLDNLQMGNPAYPGWVDLFCWSIGDENNYGATSAYNTTLYYNKSFVDWGSKFEGNWSTLSIDQWYYMLYNRANANDLWGMAMIGDTLGMVLLPNGWTAPSGVTFVPGTTPTTDMWENADCLDPTMADQDHWRVNPANMPANKFTEEEWAILEAAGAVFCPYGGRRSGGYGNHTNRDNETIAGEYAYAYYENYQGAYWTSTVRKAEEGKVYWLPMICNCDAEHENWGRGSYGWWENGRYGHSVRLVTIIPRQYTVTYDANGAEGDVPTDDAKYLDGAAVTLASASGLQKEGYVFAGWKFKGVTYNGSYTINNVLANEEIVFEAQWDLMPAVTLRDGLNDGKWGTYCPPRKVLNAAGATFYQISYMEEQGGMPYNMVFDQIDGTTLTAGKPYFFIASGAAITGIQVGDALSAADPAGVNGFYGYIGAAPMDLSWKADYNASLDNTFVIYDNSVFRINGATQLKSERCYININSTEPSRTAIPKAPARRRITMNVAGTNVATGIEDIKASEKPMKVMIDGNIYILRGEKLYDATGRLVK